MLKKLLLMIALAVSMTTQAQNEYSTLVVETKSGTTLELSLQERPQVSIGTAGCTIYCGDDVTSYVYEEVRKFYFKPYSATDIAAPKAENTISVSMIDQSKVIISGVSESSKIRMYTLDGKAITSETSANGNEITVSLDALAPGTYILNIDNKQTIKLLKR